MYLRRLKINGFKSFAAKTVLEFEPGITAIVGPNGSGKSNVADAIRWGLGEQSVKNLRLKKSEDLVFAGTEKRPKASLAEVSLLLDNSDGQMAIDFSEVELSRLLYGSGESEYRLNGRKVRLTEVQQLLAQSGFGQNSYAVIGQGMIDQLILATPAERKLLFDEASGIRQYEIKREQALRRLEQTNGNLTRVRDIIAELEPRLKTLSRQMETVRQHQDLAKTLDSKRRDYLAVALAFHQESIKAGDTELSRLNKLDHKLTGQIRALEQTRLQIESAYQTELANHKDRSEKLHDLEVERDELANDLSVKRAELALMLESSSGASQQQQEIKQLEKDLAKIIPQELELTKKIRKARLAESETLGRQDELTSEIKAANSELSKMRRETEATNRQQYIDHALAILKHLAVGLREQSLEHEQLPLLIHKAGRLLGHASQGQDDILGSMRLIQTRLNNLMRRRDEIQEQYTKAVIMVRSLELDFDHLKLKARQLREQIAKVTKLLSQQPDAATATIPSRRQNISQIEQRLKRVGEEITMLRMALSGGERAQTPQHVFTLAAELEAHKSEQLKISQRLGELKNQLESHHQSIAATYSKAKDWQNDSVIEPVIDKQVEAGDVDRLERDVSILEARLTENIQADQAAVEEYEEVSQRHTFMAEQVADLESAQSDLSKIIVELEALIKVKFEAAFADIASYFTAYFERLFNGGKASLNLVPDGTGVYGIEIKAVPPGKRVASLGALSGGELALTGIALLASILHVNPSPFVVLDEVDAALDEANSTRLADILKEIGQRSQLIVITHNRQTMQAAQSLFGVTMDEYHVSQLLSLRLEEAKQLATP